MMDMTCGLHARQRHCERTSHALGPRPEPYGQVVHTARQRSVTVWPRIAHVMRCTVLFIPGSPRRGRVWPPSRKSSALGLVRVNAGVRGMSGRADLFECWPTSRSSIGNERVQLRLQLLLDE